MFKGTEDIFEYTNSEIIDINLKYWLDESFLKIGAYFSSSGVLSPVDDKFYQKGQVWQSKHQNLVWEEGTQSVTFNGSPAVGNLDYNNGRFIFDSPISVKSTVEYNFTYKYLNIYSENEMDWFGELESYGSDEADEPGFQSKMKLPALIYATESKKFRPYQLGNGMYSENVIVMRVIAKSRGEANRIADILSEQTEKTIFLFDPISLKQNGTFPLNAKGFKNSGALTYSQLIVPKEDGGYRWRKMSLRKGIKQDCDRLKNNLYHIAVRFTAELVLIDI